MKRAERVLEHSLRERSSRPVEITWMRAGDPGYGEEWNRGRPLALGPYSGSGWATDFTCFRFAVPELCEFKGMALYLDVDMIVLADPMEMFSKEHHAAAAIPSTGRPDVIAWDCERLCDTTDWPSLASMKQSNWSIRDYTQRLFKLGELQTSLDRLWDCCDQKPPGAKLVHLTAMATQPWHPWPERFRYPPKHPNHDVQKLWEEQEEVARG